MEQYHSEHFANLHLDALGRAVGLPALDWTFGPVAFRASMAHHWLQRGPHARDGRADDGLTAARRRQSWPPTARGALAPAPQRLLWAPEQR